MGPAGKCAPQLFCKLSDQQRNQGWPALGRDVAGESLHSCGRKRQVDLASCGAHLWATQAGEKSLGSVVEIPGGKMMKPITAIRTAVLLLFFGASAVAVCGQEKQGKQEERAKPEKQEQAKPQNRNRPGPKNSNRPSHNVRRRPNRQSNKSRPRSRASSKRSQRNNRRRSRRSEAGAGSEARAG